jgi:hypothetical protein
MEERKNIPIGTFQVTNADTFDIKVWVETINGQPDTVTWNNAALAQTVMFPIAEFIGNIGTVYMLSFDVPIKIRPFTGAPLNTPEMYVYVDAYNSSIQDTLTIPIEPEGGNWVAKIPKLYYSSTVIYETHISDNVGNNVTLRDTAYIMFSTGGGIGKGMDYLYTGAIQTVTLNQGTYQIEVWGADGGDGLSATYTGGNGGKGGYAAGVLALTARTTFYLVVGERGENSSTGPGNGLGGNGGFGAGGGGGTGWMSGNVSGGGGGGGFTGVFTNSVSHANPLIIAGGGGGGGGSASSAGVNHGEGSIGGNGGGMNGQDGSATLTGNGIPFTGTTKTITAVGYGGTQSAGGASGGSTSTAGGVFFGGGGYGPEAGMAGDGVTLAGGAGAKTPNTSSSAGGSGGGGGGYYGGGGAGQYGLGGGGGSGYIGNVIDGIIANASQIDFVANPNASGYGLVKITSFASDVYAISHNLGIFNLVSPVNTDEELCAAISSPVEIELVNLGENDYDFTIDNITIGYEIVNQRGINYTGNIIIDTGGILSGESKAIELMSAMSIVAGNYTIKAYVTSAVDNFSYDDTMDCIYSSSLLSLPIDEDFSNGLLSSNFVSISTIGSDVWRPNNNTTLPVQPQNGTGILQYTGGFGTMAEFSTRQLDLYGAINPRLEFWYYHDNTASDLDNSYTEVDIVADGILYSALSLSRKGAATGWVQYTVPLNQYTTAQCVFVRFVSMNKLGSQSTQYIDRIIITSEPDLAVSEIIISPETDVCHLKNKTLSVVLRTTTNQAIDFSDYNTRLAVEVPGYSTFYLPLNQVFPGSTSNTFLIASNINLTTGNHNIRAYLTSPVDNNPSNDTAKLVIDIRPSLSITVNSLTGGINCFKIGSQVQQEVRVQNTGNVDISGIELLLHIMGDSTDEMIKEIGNIDLAAGKDTAYLFNTTYTVPNEVSYRVQVIAWMGCDSVLINSSHAAEECADIHDISIVSLNSPPIDQTDVAGSTQTISVTVKNTDDHNVFSNVMIIASIEDEQGQTLISRMGTIPTVEPSSTLPFTFTEPYIVPNDSVYYIKIYLSNQDIYPENDTLTIKRYTETVGISSIGENNVFTLGQNIPNPAANTTRIDYNIPESGEVVFNLHSISGQLLYSKTIEATSGKQSLEVNTSTFAAGIYFYSIEYKGQRLVKRMSIQK